MSRNAASVTYIDNVTGSPSLSRAGPYSRESAHDAEYDYLCKLLVIGDSGCGKSALLTRFADNSYHPGYSSTIGVDFSVRSLDVATQRGGVKSVKLQMWDTAGQERFRTITSSYYRGAHAVLVVFDVTSEESFANTRRWLAELHEAHSQAEALVAGPGGKKHAPQGDSFGNVTQVLLVANKCDLQRARVVETHRIRELAMELGLTFVEASAKTGDGVAEAFTRVAGAFVSQRMLDEASGRCAVGSGMHGSKQLKVSGASLHGDEREESSWRRCFGACAIM